MKLPSVDDAVGLCARVGTLLWRNGAPFASLLVSPDDQLVVNTSLGGVGANHLHIWSVATGELVYEIPFPSTVTCIQFHENSSRLLVGSAGVIYSVDCCSGDSSRLVDLQGPITSFCARGDRIIAVMGSHLIAGQIANGRLRRRQSVAGIGEVERLAVSPCGNFIAGTRQQKDVLLFDFSTLRQLSVRIHPFDAFGVAFILGGAAVMVTPRYQSGKAAVWQMEGGELSREPELIDGLFGYLAAATRVDLIACQSAADEIAIVQNVAPVRNIVSVGARIRAIDLSDSGELLVVGDVGGCIAVMNTHEKTPPVDEFGRQAVTCLSAVPARREVIAGYDNGEVGHYEVTGRVIRRIRLSSSRISALDVSYDGLWVAVGDDQLTLLTTAAPKLGIICLESFEAIRDLSGFEGAVTSVAFSPAGNAVAALDFAGNIRVYDVRDWEMVHCIRTGSNGWAQLAWSPNSQRVAFGMYDANWCGVAECNEHGWRWRKLATTTDFGPKAVKFIDDDRIAIGDWSGEIAVLQLSTGTVMLQVTGHRGGVAGLSVNSTGTRLASIGNYGDLVVWNLSTGSELYRQRAHRGSATAVAFGFEDAYVYTGGSDTTVAIWRAPP